MKRQKKVSPSLTLKWEVTGVCFFCFKKLMALQPGGLQVKHEDGTEYCGTLRFTPQRRRLVL